ncbi:hypothetical protein [Chitinophaga flava]|uniref:DUF3278 domain-containing protein n=1 Tax=Chitinophaga flava TaxID=2259036 RepID=A0A365XPQ9_9BACT|nr:hypothetical protein [Chitinophaga flava]RBL88317.1 hypothetical protein DF182_17125 [Chitinophaga flava]
MNFDDIQSVWNNDDDNRHIVVPGNLTKIKAVGQPVDKIRKTMQQEGIVQLLSIILMAFAPKYFGMDRTTQSAYYCLYGVMVAISGYYFSKFFLFYKRLNSNMLTTKDHLYEVYYDIKLNIEMYRSCTYSILMLALGFVTVYGLVDAKLARFFADRHIEDITIITVVLTFVTLTLLVALATEWWIKLYYGKYLREIKAILDQLREEV